jgi:hypothetical protein
VHNQNDLWTEEDEAIILHNEEDFERYPDMDVSDQQGLNLPVGSRMRSVVEYALAFHKQPGECLHQAS